MKIEWIGKRFESDKYPVTYRLERAFAPNGEDRFLYSIEGTGQIALTYEEAVELMYQLKTVLRPRSMCSIP